MLPQRRWMAGICAECNSMAHPPYHPAAGSSAPWGMLMSESKACRVATMTILSKPFSFRSSSPGSRHRGSAHQPGHPAQLLITDPRGQPHRLVIGDLVHVTKAGPQGKKVSQLFARNHWPSFLPTPRRDVVGDHHAGDRRHCILVANLASSVRRPMTTDPTRLRSRPDDLRVLTVQQLDLIWVLRHPAWSAVVDAAPSTAAASPARPDPLLLGDQALVHPV